MIRINCFIRVNPGKKAEVTEAARRLTEMSLQEEGCKAYDIFASETRDDVMMMICETWADEVALTRHINSNHFEEYVGKMRSAAQLSMDKFIF